MKTFRTIWKVIVTVLMVALDYWWIKSMIVNNNGFFTLADYLFWGFVSTFICVCMWILFCTLEEY